jgi:hypothetical protein
MTVTQNATATTAEKTEQGPDVGRRTPPRQQCFGRAVVIILSEVCTKTANKKREGSVRGEGVNTRREGKAETKISDGMYEIVHTKLFQRAVSRIPIPTEVKILPSTAWVVIRLDPAGLGGTLLS